MSTKPTIIYTKTDEAPALATYSFLPIIRAFASTSGVDVELRDISLAGRILAVFPECLSEEQRVEDALKELGERTQDPTTNIIKLPNISASDPKHHIPYNLQQPPHKHLHNWNQELRPRYLVFLL